MALRLRRHYRKLFLNQLSIGLDDGLMVRHSIDRVDGTLTTLDRAPAILGASWDRADQGLSEGRGDGRERQRPA